MRYDGGDELEVVNIASRLRVILQGPKSLIGQLHLAKDLRFRDTSTHRLDPERNICIANIWPQVMPDGARWRPLLDGWPNGHPMPPPQHLRAWWTEPIMPTSTPDGLDIHLGTAERIWCSASRIRMVGRTLINATRPTTGSLGITSRLKLPSGPATRRCLRISQCRAMRYTPAYDRSGTKCSSRSRSIFRLL